MWKVARSKIALFFKWAPFEIWFPQKNKTKQTNKQTKKTNKNQTNKQTNKHNQLHKKYKFCMWQLHFPEKEGKQEQAVDPILVAFKVLL